MKSLVDGLGIRPCKDLAVSKIVTDPQTITPIERIIRRLCLVLFVLPSNDHVCFAEIHSGQSITVAKTAADMLGTTNIAITRAQPRGDGVQDGALAAAVGAGQEVDGRLVVAVDVGKPDGHIVERADFPQDYGFDIRYMISVGHRELNHLFDETSMPPFRPKSAASFLG